MIVKIQDQDKYYTTAGWRPADKDAILVSFNDAYKYPNHKVNKAKLERKEHNDAVVLKYRPTLKYNPK